MDGAEQALQAAPEPKEGGDPEHIGQDRHCPPATLRTAESPEGKKLQLSRCGLCQVEPQRGARLGTHSRSSGG